MTEARSVEQEEIKLIASPKQVVMEALQQSLCDQCQELEMARADCQELLNQGNKADQDKIRQKHLELRKLTGKCEVVQESATTT